ncbi:hypothetical protein EVC30_023 [Rhizobium phage RHph_Y1_11]|nr:hypothetical protein EVC30_023 [Rhizobium phage RHph_Y1_11]
MVFLLNKSQLKEPAATPPSTPKPSKAKLNNAIDAYVGARLHNSDIEDKIKALETEKIDEKPLLERIFEEMPPHYPEQLAAKDKEFFIESPTYKLKIGKMGTKRVITNIGYIFDKMKKAAFLAACSFPLSSVDKYLTPDEQAECVAVEDTKRNVTFVGPAEKAKAKG